MAAEQHPVLLYSRTVLVEISRHSILSDPAIHGTLTGYRVVESLLLEFLPILLWLSNHMPWRAIAFDIGL